MPRLGVPILGWALLTGTLGVALVDAATAQPVPPTVEPGRLSPEREPPAPRSSLDDVLVGAPLVQRPEQPVGPEFFLREIVLDGVTVYDDAELLKPHRSLLGTNVTLSTLYDVADAITVRYRNDGFILSRAYVPQQTIRDGVVTIRVVEGYLAQVRFTGELKGRRQLLDRVAARLRESRPLRARDLERYLLLLNDLPGVVAQGVLVASETPGAADLHVTIDHKFVDFDADTSNRGSEYLGPIQQGVTLSFNSALRAYESTTFRYLAAGENDELEHVAFSHSHVFGPRGVRLTLSASRSEAVPDLGADFAAYNLETSSDDASVRVDVPLRRSRARNLTYFARLTRHDGETESLLFAERSADRISAFRTGFTFDSAGPRRGVNIVEVEYSQGLDAFDASKITDENLSRPGGDPEFSKLTLYAARLQSIRGRWSMLFALTAQKAFDNLLGPEEFGFGGEYFGRAYDPSEIVGDQGAAAKMEIRYTWYTSRGSGLTAYTFWDVGEVRQRLAESEVVTKTSDSAASAGLGLRFNLGRNVTGYVESATPLTQSVVAEGTDDTRVFGGIRVRF